MRTLIVVDMQNDFITGAFANKDAQAIVPGVVEYIRNWDGKIILTMDTHEHKDYSDYIEGQLLPMHCEQNSEGWAIEQSVLEATHDKKDVGFYQKDSFGDFALTNRMRSYNISVEQNPDYCLKCGTEPYTEVVLIGLCTDICVVSNALMLRAALPKVPIKVIANLCAGTTPENHEAALKVMKSCCIEVVEE